MPRGRFIFFAALGFQCLKFPPKSQARDQEKTATHCLDSAAQSGDVHIGSLLDNGDLLLRNIEVLGHPNLSQLSRLPQFLQGQCLRQKLRGAVADFLALSSAQFGNEQYSNVCERCSRPPHFHYRTLLTANRPRRSMNAIHFGLSDPHDRRGPRHWRGGLPRDRVIGYGDQARRAGDPI